MYSYRLSPMYNIYFVKHVNKEELINIIYHHTYVCENFQVCILNL